MFLIQSKIGSPEAPFHSATEDSLSDYGFQYTQVMSTFFYFFSTLTLQLNLSSTATLHCFITTRGRIIHRLKCEAFVHT